jgi:hypothetical protein
MKQDLSREQVLAVALEDYRKNLPTPDNDVPKTDWSKIETYGGWDRRPLNVYNNNTTYTKVTCKDGTIQNQPSSPTAKYDDSCRNNGGVDNQKQYEDALKNEQIEKNKRFLIAQNTSEYDKKTAEDKFYEMFGIKKSKSGDIGIQSRPLGRLLVAGVLVAGYFAYKKFKN